MNVRDQLIIRKLIRTKLLNLTSIANNNKKLTIYTTPLLLLSGTTTKRVW